MGHNFDGVPAGFMRTRVLPAVRDNASLRELEIIAVHDIAADELTADDANAREEAERIVAAR